MKGNKWFLLFLFIIVICGISEKKVEAAIDFGVSPVLPENQIDQNLTYFDLLMSPGVDQDVTVEIKNTSSEKITVNIEINSATTNHNGVIEYGLNHITPDSSLLYNLKDYVTADSQVEIPANCTVPLTVHIKMPPENFDGIMVGGLTFSQEGDGAEMSTNENSANVSTKFAYVMGIVLRQNQKKLTPKMNLVAATAGQVNKRNVIFVDLQNPVADFLRGLRVEAKIYKKDSNQLVYEMSRASMDMAPNSLLSFPVPCEKTPLKSGDYVAQVVTYAVISDDGTYEALDGKGKEAKYVYQWTFEKEFKIEVAEAEALNREDVNLIQSGYKEKSTLPYIILSIILLGIIAAMVYHNWRKKSKNEADEKK